MAEAVRIEAECDGVAAPWERGRPLYRFVPGTVLLLLRNDDPRFLKVAYDGKPVFIPRDAGVLIEIERGAVPCGPGGAPLEVPGPVSWQRSELAAAGILAAGVFAAGFVLIPLAFAVQSFGAMVMVWGTAVLLLSLLVARRSSVRAAALGSGVGSAAFLAFLGSLISALEEI